MTHATGAFFALLVVALFAVAFFGLEVVSLVSPIVDGEPELRVNDGLETDVPSGSASTRLRCRTWWSVKISGCLRWAYLGRHCGYCMF
jgi:hypothetical protein